jgi:YVTN family beta-propeller protein
VSGVAVTPDGLKAYVSSEADSKIAVLSINPSTNAVTDTGVRVTVPSGTPSGWYGVPGLAVTPDGTRLYIAAGISNKVSVLDTSTDTIVGTITVGSRPSGIGMPGKR